MMRSQGQVLAPMGVLAGLLLVAGLCAYVSHMAGAFACKGQWPALLGEICAAGFGCWCVRPGAGRQLPRLPPLMGHPWKPVL